MPWISEPPPASRRRVLVFFLTFLPALIAGLTYVYRQPPEYRAVARLQISPAAIVTQATDAKDAPSVVTDAKSFLSEVQVLTSRPLVQDVVAHLRSSDNFPDLGPDPVVAAQRMLHTETVEGTQIVRLAATGPDPDFVSRLVNAVADAYRKHVADAYKGLATSTYGEVNDEQTALENKVAGKREAVNAFRKRYDIVSMEHKENDILADIEGLSQSYTDANEKLAKAEGRVEALRNGKIVIHAKDDPTLADLQQRASVLREQWHDLERRFTPAYLAFDADAKSMRARLDNLDEQLKAQIGASQRSALDEAEQNLAAAQAEVARLRKDVADNQRQAQEFATHLNDYKAMREDLDHLEGMHRAALDQLAKLQASERERAPRMQILEAAAPSREPWRPDYRLEAALAVAGSFAFGLFATWFVDFISGSGRPTPAFVPYPWAPALIGPEASLPRRLLATPDVARLPAPAPPPRELADTEISALIAAATEDARLMMLVLLAGMTVEEVVRLRWDDIDVTAGTVRIGGEGARTAPLDEPLRSLLVAGRQQAADQSGTVLRAADGSPVTGDWIARSVLFTAYDAGLERPQEATADALRYTYLCFLLRQGVRAADIGGIAGQVPPNDLVAYMQLHSPTARRPLDQIERVLPVLRGLASGALG